LFQPQGQRKDDFGIAQVLFYAIIRIALLDVELRKFVGQALCEPGGHIPQIEVVIDNDQELHDLSEGT
jgi:hypothetical protein